MSVNLYYNLYKDIDNERNNEILYCYKSLLNNKAIDNIYIFKNEYVNVKDNDKIAVIINNDRPTYHDYFETINKYSSDNDINIIINSDCFILEEGINLIKENIKDDEFWCISRYEVKTINPLSVSYMKTKCSQDCWIVKGKIKENNIGNYVMGIPGCDNTIAYELNLIGYRLLNPSLSVIIYHYHLTDVRRYIWDESLKQTHRYVENVSLTEAEDKNRIVNKINKYWPLEGNLNYNQRDRLIDILYYLKPMNVLEIGFGTGRSAITILCTCNPLKFVSVDLGYNGIDDYENSIKKDFNNLKLIKNDSFDLLTDDFFKIEYNKELDFAFIDGATDYETVKHDIEKCYQYLNINGIIVVDDYDSYPPEGCVIKEVNDAVNDFCFFNDVVLDKCNENGKGFAIIKRKK